MVMVAISTLPRDTIKRPCHGDNQQRHQKQLLLNGRAIDRRQNKLRSGDVLHRFLEHRTQQLKEKKPLPYR